MERRSEKDIKILQHKKVISVEIRDIETGSGDVYVLKDAGEISRIIPLLKYPCNQVCQMSHGPEITFKFEDGARALGSFNYDPEEKELYLGDWVFDNPELWSLFKEHFGVQEDVKHFVLRRINESEEHRKLHDILTRIVELNDQILKLRAEKRELERTLRELTEEIKNKSNK